MGSLSITLKCTPLGKRIYEYCVYFGKSETVLAPGDIRGGGPGKEFDDA